MEVVCCLGYHTREERDVFVLCQKEGPHLIDQGPGTIPNYIPDFSGGQSCKGLSN